MTPTSKACTFKRIDINEADLPLSCPMPTQRLWDAHPKVYLPIEQTGHAVCPYCETEYFLITKTDNTHAS